MKLFQRQPKCGGTLICLKYSLVKSNNKCYYFKIVIPCSQQKYSSWQKWFWWLSKQREKDASLCFWSCFWSSHTLFCHASDTICSKDKNHYAFGHAFGQVILCLAMLLLTQYAPTTHFPLFGAKMKFTIHCYYSFITIHCYYSPFTIHSEFLPI